MSTLKLNQFCSCDIQQERELELNITRNGNRVGLLGSVNNAILLELIHENSSVAAFPYYMSYVSTPQTRPCKTITDLIPLQNIYANCSVEEAQELALEPVYVSECAIDTLKARTVQLGWAPKPLHGTDQPLVAVLNSFGACCILTKTPLNIFWQKEELCNLNSALMDDVFPMEKVDFANITNFQEFKGLVDLYWITALVWATDAQILYVTNAAGYLVAFKFNESTTQPQEICKLQTHLGRINFIKLCDELIFVGNLQGQLQLFKLERTEEGKVKGITALKFLWQKVDRMTCHNLEASYSKTYNCYFVLFTKAAHVLVVSLTAEGQILCKSNFYVDGAIKITDLERLHPQEFIITTITGVVQSLKLSINAENVLKVHNEVVATDIDSENHQVLGVAFTLNRALCSLILYRNKEYNSLINNRAHKDFHDSTCVIFSVCAVSSMNALEHLTTKLKLDAIDRYLDVAVSLHLDILFDKFPVERYYNYCDLAADSFPTKFDEDLLSILHLKIFMLRVFNRKEILKSQRMRYDVQTEMSFLENCLLAVHILCRLKYLVKQEALSAFQQLAGKCMQNRIHLIFSELEALMKKEENPYSGSIYRFLQFARNELFSVCSARSKLSECVTELCFECGTSVDSATMLCGSAHKVPRCCVSFVQVQRFNKRFCPQCLSFAHEDDSALQQLFRPNELIKCTLCCFLFVYNRIGC